MPQAEGQSAEGSAYERCVAKVKERLAGENVSGVDPDAKAAQVCASRK